MAADPTTFWQVASVAMSAVSALGIGGIFYRLGQYTQKVDGHDEKLCNHDKRLERHDDKIGTLEQKWSSVSGLPGSP